MEPVDAPRDSAVVRAVARHHRPVTGQPPAVIGALLPMSYSAGESFWQWKARIACLHYGLAGGFLEVGPGGSYVLISEMVVAAKVPALTAPAVCGVAA
jgi:hypothetical protein